MDIGILSIGSELLEGSVIDTNSAFIGSHLTLLGHSPKLIRMIGDNKDELVEYIKELSKKYDIVFTTGGLGPTFDDITAECLAIAGNNKIELNEKAYNHMKECLEKAGVELRDNHKRQAMLPVGADLFHNYTGTAMGFSVVINKCRFISMPGVPYEMKPMFEKEIIPFLYKNYNIDNISYTDIHIAQVPESDVDKVIRELNIPEDIRCIINAGSGEVVVKLRGSNKEKIEEISHIIADSFPENFIGFNGKNIGTAFVDMLIKNNKTIATAESCTGGFIAKTLTDISGVSSVYYGSVVSYDNSVKENVLNVSKDDLERYGAVSEIVAKQMAEGVCQKLGTGLGISTTGIAGPAGGSEEKPVGTVYIGISDGVNTEVYHHIFRGDRALIRQRAVYSALFHGIKFLRKYYG